MNLLHEFLHQGNIQARAVIGDTFDWNGQSDLIGFFTPTSGSMAFEIAGFTEEIDLVAVVDLDQFDTGNEPVLADKETLVWDDNLYLLRSLKKDQSAYTLGFKLIGPAVAGILRKQVFTVDLVTGEETKAIVFPDAFEATPRGIYLTLSVPTDGSLFEVGVSLDTPPTALGFTATFGAAVPGTGYQLNVIAYL